MDADAAAGTRWGLVGCSHFCIGREIGSLVAVLPSDYEDFVISAPLRPQTGIYAEFVRETQFLQVPSAVTRVTYGKSQ